MSTKIIPDEKLSRQGKNAKRKGGQYERTLAKRFQEVYNVELKRTPQSGGFAKKSEKADDYRGDITIVDNTKMLLLHIEAKNQKTLKIHSWIEQAKEDCPQGRIPIVIFHEYGTSRNYVIVERRDFLKLIDSPSYQLQGFSVFNHEEALRISALNWIQHAEQNCEENTIPAITFRGHDSDVYVMIHLEDFLKKVPKSKVIGKRKFK